MTRQNDDFGVRSHIMSDKKIQEINAQLKNLVERRLEQDTHNTRKSMCSVVLLVFWLMTQAPKVNDRLSMVFEYWILYKLFFLV